MGFSSSTASSTFLNFYVIFLLYSPYCLITCFFLIFFVCGYFKFFCSDTSIAHTYKAVLMFCIRILFIIIFIIFILIVLGHSYFAHLWALSGLLWSFSHSGISGWAYSAQHGIYLNPLGWALFFTCFITSLISLFYLGDVDFLANGSATIYYFFFLICTWFMINTINLLMLFLSFELIFFPSLYFVFSLGYGNNVDKAIFYFFSWTLFGSFLVLGGLVYIYSIYETLNFELLSYNEFTVIENYILFWVFFIGFGVNVPLFPFHYWLTNVHVEAPAGFSMFLSGYLVKTAIYCFYSFNLLFGMPNCQTWASIWILLTILESSVNMWSQVDLNNLIAFSTIQEMSMILLLVITGTTSGSSILVTFIVMHGFLSSYMFFLVDNIQRISQTRNIISLSGLGAKFPILSRHIWIMLLLYLGLPLTIKFLIEWVVGSLMLLYFGWFGFFIFFFSFFFGAIGFTNCWFLIMYGNPSAVLGVLHGIDFTNLDAAISNILLISLLSLHLIVFIL